MIQAQPLKSRTHGQIGRRLALPKNESQPVQVDGVVLHENRGNPSAEVRHGAKTTTHRYAAALFTAFSLMTSPLLAATAAAAPPQNGALPTTTTDTVPAAATNAVPESVDPLASTSPQLTLRPPDGAHQVVQAAVRLEHLATDPRPLTLGGIPFTFQPVHVFADPFAQGIGNVETDAELAHLEYNQMRFHGSWKVENGFQAGFLVRHTFGNPKSDPNENVLEPNFIGPRFEFFQRLTYPLDGAARSDNADSRAAGSLLPPHASALDGNWLSRAVSGGTYFFAETVEGTEFHFDHDAVRPYYRVMTGIEKDIPLESVFGRRAGIVLRMGPEIRGTTVNAAEPRFYIEADYKF